MRHNETEWNRIRWNQAIWIGKKQDETGFNQHLTLDANQSCFFSFYFTYNLRLLVWFLFLEQTFINSLSPDQKHRARIKIEKNKYFAFDLFNFICFSNKLLNNFWSIWTLFMLEMQDELSVHLCKVIKEDIRSTKLRTLLRASNDGT